MTFVEFLSYADPAELLSLLVTSPLLAFKYTGLFGLLILLTGVVGAVLVRAAFRGVRVYPWRAFLTLGAASLAFGCVGAYWGYVGVLQTLERYQVQPTAAQLAGGALQTWSLIVFALVFAGGLTAAGALVAKRRPAPEPLPA